MSIQQDINFFKTRHGTQIAYAHSGSGEVLLRVGCWLTHLTQDLNCPVWGHWIEFLSSRHTLVRYDQRGNGLSERDVGSLSFEELVQDLEDLVDHLELDQFTLLGLSTGAGPAIEYAARYPNKVKQLIIYNSGAVGADHVPDHPVAKRWHAMETLISTDWGRSDNGFTTLLCNEFVPGASAEMISAYERLAQRSSSNTIAASIMRINAEMNLLDRLPQVSVPTHIFHLSDYFMVPLIASQLISARIPDCGLSIIDSQNHFLLDDEPGWAQFKSLFTQIVASHETTEKTTDADHTITAPADNALLNELTERERMVLAAIAEGGSNRDIGEKLFISEKTVRNHVSNIYSKLDLKNRAQAIVFVQRQGETEVRH